MFGQNDIAMVTLTSSCLTRSFWSSIFEANTVTRKNIDESSCLLSDCFSCISPEPLELKKSCLHLFAFLSEELSDDIFFFKSSHKIS